MAGRWGGGGRRGEKKNSRIEEREGGGRGEVEKNL